MMFCQSLSLQYKYEDNRETMAERRINQRYHQSIFI